MTPPFAPPPRLTLLWFFCGIQAAFCCFAFYRFNESGYLPAPFVYDKSDTFMDFFHPLFWSDDSGLYTVWGSVYPPLNFLLLQSFKTLASGNYQLGNAFELRTEARLFLMGLVLVYLAIPLLVLRTRPWRMFSSSETVPIYLAIVLASPMLFVLERGNLILLALPLLALAVAAAGTLTCIMIAFLINIKPYFAIIIMVFLLARRFQDAWVITLAAGAIFLASGIWIDNQFLVFLINLVSFSQSEELFSVREMLSLPSNVSVYSQVLRVYYAQGGELNVIGINLQLLATLVDSIKWLILCAASGIIWATRGMPTTVLIALSIAIISNLGVSVGGYSIVFYIPLIPVLYVMKHRRFYIAAIFVLLAPLDAIGLLTQNIGDQTSYLSGRLLSIDWDLAAGVFIRPPLNLALLAVLSWEVYSRYVPKVKPSAATTGPNLKSGPVAPHPA